MYHPTVIESSIASYEKQSGHKLLRIPKEKCEDWARHLKNKWDEQEETWLKPLTKEERTFIRNELVMSAFDFLYWAERYATIQQDGGGICKFSLWESQRLLYELIQKVELETYEATQRGELVDGIMVCLHKARQLGATAFGRCWMMHVLTTQKYRRGISASVDDDKIMELYDRDKLIYDNLPHWLRSPLKYDEKGQHIYFEGMDSRMLYQVDSQKTGIGVGRQFDIHHFTECSTWTNPDRIQLDFFPTIPRSRSTRGLLESTAFGRGNWWHEFTEAVRNGEEARWHYKFIPWYAEVTKYRAQPPVGWQPDKVSLLHAQKCFDSSPEFMGRSVHLTKEQLYWWESTRSSYLKQHKLNYFLTNWCATPEESFQHSGQAPFDPGLIEELRLMASVGKSFEFEYSPRA